MSVAALLPYQQQILSAIGSSTGFHPINDELAAWVAQSLAASAGRAQAAQERSQAHSDAVRGGIRAAVGALPVGARGAAGIVQRRILRKGPATYCLQRVPDVETVRAVLRAMLAEKHSLVSVPVSAPESIKRCDASAIATETTRAN